MKKILTLLMAATLVVIAAAPALAADETKYADWKGTTQGDEVILNKDFVMPMTAQVPDVTFTYTLTVPASGIDATATQPAVFVGKDPASVIIYDKALANPGAATVDGSGNSYGTLVYASTATTVNGDQNGANTATKKNAEKEIAIDFSQVEFTEPGIYRYYLQETSSSNLTQNDVEVGTIGDPDSGNTWRTIDVYVTNIVKYFFEGATQAYDTKAEADAAAVTAGKTADDVKEVSALTVSDVVYEGKQTAAPNAATDPAATPSPFDIGKDASGLGIKNATWTYVNSGTKYEYKYVKDSITEEWGWEETRTTGSVVETNRNKTDYLNQTTTTDITVTTSNYKDAVEAGATDGQLQAATWKYTDASGMEHTYTYAGGTWKDSARSTGTADQPTDTATADVQTTTSGTTENMTYAKARANEKYILGELTQRVWVDTSVAGTTKTFTYDAAARVWNVETVVENTTGVVIPDDAEAATPISINPVNYTYAEKKEKEAQKNGAEVTGAKKSERFVNEYFTQTLEVSKTVTGNQGSRDKYFAFTIELNAGINAAGVSINVGTDSVMTLTTNDPTGTAPNAATTETVATISAANSLKTYTLDADGKATITVYLKHGEKIVLENIPTGATYTVTEASYAAEGYKTSLDVTGDTKTNDGDTDATNDAALAVGDVSTVTDNALMHDAAVAFTNDRTGVIPTGVLMSITGGVALVAVAAAGLFVLNRKKKEEE